MVAGDVGLGGFRLVDPYSFDSNSLRKRGQPRHGLQCLIPSESLLQWPMKGQPGIERDPPLPSLTPSLGCCRQPAWPKDKAAPGALESLRFFPGLSELSVVSP